MLGLIGCVCDLAELNRAGILDGRVRNAVLVYTDRVCVCVT